MKKAFLTILFAKYLSESSQFKQQKNILRIFRKNSPTMIP